MLNVEKVGHLLPHRLQVSICSSHISNMSFSILLISLEMPNYSRSPFRSTDILVATSNIEIYAAPFDEKQNRNHIAEKTLGLCVGRLDKHSGKYWDIVFNILKTFVCIRICSRKQAPVQSRYNWFGTELEICVAQEWQSGKLQWKAKRVTTKCQRKLYYQSQPEQRVSDSETFTTPMN